MELEITDSDSLLDALQSVREAFKAGGKVTITLKSERGMTASQRASVHIWCEQMARILNEAGVDQKMWFERYARKGIDVPWSKLSVKDCFYKPVLESISQKKSTEEMTTMEPSEICTIVGKALSERLGITPPPFPSRFGQ